MLLFEVRYSVNVHTPNENYQQRIVVPGRNDFEVLERPQN